MVILEIILLIANLIISFAYIKRAKIIGIILSLVSFIGFCWGYIEANLFIMDAVYPDKQIRLGNLIMIIFLIFELLIFIKLIIDISKNKKEGGKEKCQE